ncbi:DUF1631 family protein [Pulveribacter sp.]|uniref:DUF1631 family protein n=1 Tax=Pulveribacter sp. TaxID=2678893 RepID=UPI0028A7D07E|nr:DUF1631 family protein [Pulveribacter sp.]
MPLPASRARTVFRACVVNAIRDGETLMEQLVTRTRSALSEEEASSRDIQRRNQAGDALRLLHQHEAQLVKGYPMALLEAFAEGPAQPRAKGAAPSDTGIDFGELALMDDTEVLAQVEMARAQQVAALATEAALAELNALVSSAQGLGSVQAERNPLRPENYIRALQQVVADTGVSAEVRQQWMAQMREQLGQQLVDVYQRTARGLREQGVEPVGYAVAGMAGASRTGYGTSTQMGVGGGYAPSSMHSGLSSHYGAPVHGSGWGAAASGGMPLAPAAEEALLTVGMLRQMLAGMGDPHAFDPVRGGAVPSGYMAVPPHGGYVTQEAADAMQDLAQLEQLVGRLAGAPAGGEWVNTSALIPASAPMPAVPMPVPQPSPERAAQDVVSRMMDNIAQDSRLLPSMQRAIQSLAPALRELVRHDTRFFSDEQHPARRLLDELTQRSLAFDREDSPSFGRFMRLVNEVVGHLATARIESSAPFERVLRALEKAWETQERHRRERREAKERERQLREQRDLLAERLSADFRRLPDAGGAPADLLAFVTGPWAAVVALAQTPEGAEATGDDPGGYLALVPLLLAVGQESQLRAEPERLGQALAAALPTLREGLMSINHPAEGIQALEERLLGLQRLAQDWHDEQQRQAEAARAQEQARAEAEAAEAAAAPLAELPTDSLAAPLAAQDELPTQSEMQALAQEPKPDVPAADAKGALQIGQWVEIVSQQGAVQTQLTWASPHNTLFLFTGLDGSTQSMTRRMIDKLSGEGSFRMLEGAPAPAAQPRGARARQR